MEALECLKVFTVYISLPELNSIESLQHETGWDVIKEKCRNYRVDMEKLKDACWERPIISTDYIQSAAHIMQAVASYLCLEKMAIIKQEDLPIRIDEYIAKHYMEEINVQTICTKFRIGKTALYDIAAQNYGEGIAAHIRSLRIEKAKELLTEDCDMIEESIPAASNISRLQTRFRISNPIVLVASE